LNDIEANRATSSHPKISNDQSNHRGWLTTPARKNICINVLLLKNIWERMFKTNGTIKTIRTMIRSFSMMLIIAPP